MGKRLGGVLVALLFSGGPPAIAVALATTSARGRSGAGPSTAAGLRSAAWALLTWEMFVVLVGGGYWLHYLMGLVPGLVVLPAAASAQVSPRRSRFSAGRRAYAYTACSTVAVLGWVLVHPIERPEESAISYLACARAPGGTPPSSRSAPRTSSRARGCRPPVPPAVEPARPGARPGRPRADLRRGTHRTRGTDLAGGLGSVGEHLGASTALRRTASSGRATTAGRERRRVPDLRAQGPPVTAGVGVDRPRTVTRPRVRVAAMAGFAALPASWSLLVGIPNDTGRRGAVGVVRPPSRGTSTPRLVLALPAGLVAAAAGPRRLRPRAGAGRRHRVHTPRDVADPPRRVAGTPLGRRPLPTVSLQPGSAAIRASRRAAAVVRRGLRARVRLALPGRADRRRRPLAPRPGRVRPWIRRFVTLTSSRSPLSLPDGPAVDGCPGRATGAAVPRQQPRLLRPRIERTAIVFGGLANKSAAMPSLHAGLAFLLAFFAIRAAAYARGGGWCCSIR